MHSVHNRLHSGVGAPAETRALALRLIHRVMLHLVQQAPAQKDHGCQWDDETQQVRDKEQNHPKVHSGFSTDLCSTSIPKLPSM